MSLLEPEPQKHFKRLLIYLVPALFLIAIIIPSIPGIFNALDKPLSHHGISGVFLDLADFIGNINDHPQSYIPLVFVGVGIYFILGARKKHQILMSRGLIEFATITKIEKKEVKVGRRRKPRPVLEVTIKHSQPIKKVWLIDVSMENDLRVGDKIQIIYDPQNPSTCNLKYKGSRPIIKKTQL